MNFMINPTSPRPTTPINGLSVSNAAPQTPNYQEILVSMTSSPKLPEILKKTNTSLSDLEYIDFQQFLQDNNLTNLCDDYFDKNDHIERYETQLKRRVRQLQILLEMQIQYSSKRPKNTSAQKTSRCKIETPKHKKNLDYSHQLDLENPKDQKPARRNTSKSHQFDNNQNSRRASHSQRKVSKMSLFSSRYSRQDASNHIETYKKIKQVQILQAYTEGKPYIEQYYNQLKHRMKDLEDEKQKVMARTSRDKISRKSSKAGKIKKQLLLGQKSSQNQYENEFSQQDHKTKRPSQNTNRKSATKLFQANEYAMMPVKNHKLKPQGRNKSKNLDREACKQLVTQVKKYEEINEKYIKKLKSIDKNDRHSRQKLFEASSKDKFETKKNIEQLKNRINSRGSKKY